METLVMSFPFLTGKNPIFIRAATVKSSCGNITELHNVLIKEEENLSFHTEGRVILQLSIGRVRDLNHRENWQP
jgi:hypothetical protein